MSIEDKQPKPGDIVVLVGLPPGFLDDLPVEEQLSISEMVGKPIVFNEIDNWGSAELEFTDKRGHFHFLHVDLSFIRPVD